MTSQRTGSCLCNAIQYRLTGDPAQMFICHCTSCQKSSGSAFRANCIFRKEQLEITKGKDTLKTYHDHSTQSGETLHRSFCGACGSGLFVSNETGEKGEFIAVSSGTVAERDDLHPTIEVWERDRRPWLAPVEGVVRMHTQ